jgi:hypothetical protein
METKHIEQIETLINEIKGIIAEAKNSANYEGHLAEQSAIRLTIDLKYFLKWVYHIEN